MYVVFLIELNHFVAYVDLLQKTDPPPHLLPWDPISSIETNSISMPRK